jgi:hypothetical protein
MVGRIPSVNSDSVVRCLDPFERIYRESLYNKIIYLLDCSSISARSKYHVVCMVKHDIHKAFLEENKRGFK